MIEIKFIEIYFDLINNLQLFHWTTKSYSDHIASDTTLKELYKKTDELIESWIQNKKLKIDSNVNINIKKNSKNIIIKKLKKFKEFIKKIEFPKESESELNNIRDEIMGIIDHSFFLLSLQ